MRTKKIAGIGLGMVLMVLMWVGLVTGGKIHDAVNARDNDGHTPLASGDPLDNEQLPISLPQGAFLRGIAYGKSTFVAVGDFVILTSLDGITWTSRMSGSKN